MEATTGEIVYDSASDFEIISGKFGGKNYNANQIAGSFDSRSDAKGPEPEAVTVAKVKGRSYAFVAMERSGFVFIYDITVPKSSHCIGMIDTLGEKGEDRGPEFMKFVSAEDNTSGHHLLLIGFEKSQTISAFAISF